MATVTGGTWVQNSKDPNDWSYKDSGGNIVTNVWAKDSKGKDYYLGSNGKMAVNTVTPDGYAVGADGAWNNTEKQAALPQQSSLGVQVYDPTADIKAMAEAQKKAALAGLDKAHNQSLSDLNYAKGQIEPAYYTARNNTSTDAQIAAKNFAEYMASRGMTNSGTAAQSDIANNVALQGNLGSLAKGEARAYADNAKQVGDLNTAYNNDIASTNAGIDISTMQALINAQQQLNAQKLAQANTDRAFNYQVGRDYTTDTGRLTDGSWTLNGQNANMQNQLAALQLKYQPQIYQGQITNQDMQNQLAALQLKYQPQIYQGQIDGQTLQNAYQQLVNNGYPAQQAADLAYKAAQTANVNKSTSLMGLKSSGRGGGSGRDSSGGSSKGYSNTDYKNSNQKTIHDYANSNATLAQKLQALSGAANDTEMSPSDRAYAKEQQQALLAGRWYAGM